VDSLLDKITIKKVKHALQKFSKGFKSSRALEIWMKLIKKLMMKRMPKPSKG
jgi:hypothetical protein